jgi:hypothetical protein
MSNKEKTKKKQSLEAQADAFSRLKKQSNAQCGSFMTGPANFLTIRHP